MKDKINKICTELNDGKIAVVQATEQLFDLYSVSQQRELLKAYSDWHKKYRDSSYIDPYNVDNYLQSFEILHPPFSKSKN